MESLAAPRPEWIANLAVLNPKVAYALVLQAPRAPILLNIEASFATGAPNKPIEAQLSSFLADDVWVEDIVYTVQRPNAYVGNILKEQSDANNQLIPGVDVKIIAGSAPHYLLSPDFVPLQNVAPIFERRGSDWTLDQGTTIHAEFVLTRTLFDAPGNSELPYNIDITFLGQQFFDRFLQKVTDTQARECLRKMGFWVPDLQCVAC